MFLTPPLSEGCLLSFPLCIWSTDIWKLFSDNRETFAMEMWFDPAHWCTVTHGCSFVFMLFFFITSLAKVLPCWPLFWTMLDLCADDAASQMNYHGKQTKKEYLSLILGRSLHLHSLASFLIITFSVSISNCWRGFRVSGGRSVWCPPITRWEGCSLWLLKNCVTYSLYYNYDCYWHFFVDVPILHQCSLEIFAWVIIFILPKATPGVLESSLCTEVTSLEALN